jgi:4-amino-4-deoxy-L-arabinose transferase-like glycosyltransferase
MPAPPQISARAAPAGRLARADRAAARLLAWLLPAGSGPGRAVLLIAGLAVVGLPMLIGLKLGQDVHFDSAEAYAWGRQLLWGYGKHPPFSGWLAWAWFGVFPAADWSVYALARLCAFGALAGVYLTVLQASGARKAAFATLVTALWVYLNMRGSKYNPDLVMLALVPLLAAAVLRAVERRTAAWGALAGALAAACVLTKYWGVVPAGALLVGALAHPDRSAILRSPAFLAAVAVFALALAPHVAWLVARDFDSFAYARMWATAAPRDVASRSVSYLAHHAALLAIPLAAAVLLTRPWRSPARRWPPLALVVALAFAAMALLPSLAANLFTVLLRTDWGIPIFALAPATLVLWPRLQVSRRALARALALVLALHAALLVGGPLYAAVAFRLNPGAGLFTPYSELARAANLEWRARISVPLPVVVSGFIPAAYLAFYAPDHPAMFGEGDPRFSPWLDPLSLARTGALGVCVPETVNCGEPSARLVGGEPFPLTVRRSLLGFDGPPLTATVRLRAPGAAP